MKIRQQGFSIIEMMVGLTIGLLGLLAVTQVMVNFNRQRTTTTQNMEAQSNGSMALFLLQRDLNQGAYGMMPLKNCNKFQWFWDPAAIAPSTTQPCDPNCGVQHPFTRGAAPVYIKTNAGSSDEITVQYAVPKSGSPGTKVKLDQSTYLPPGDFTAPYRVSSTLGFEEGDLIIADVVQQTGGIKTHYCTMSRLTRVNGFTDPVNNAPLNETTTPRQLTLEHDTVYVPHPDPHPEYADYNPTAVELTSKNPNSIPTSDGWKTAPIETLISNLGGFVSKNYSIANSKLMVGAFPKESDTEELADGIVYMRAQYGLDTEANLADYVKSDGEAKKGDTVVDKWASDLQSICVPTAAPGENCIPDADGTVLGKIYYNRIIAVRVGIVARSPFFEKDPVDAPTVLTVLPAIGTPATTAVTWNVPDTHYRYKTYYTIIPFKNTLWTP